MCHSTCIVNTVYNKAGKNVGLEPVAFHSILITRPPSSKLVYKADASQNLLNA